MRYLLLGLFAFFGSSVSAAEVVSASFYTHPQTGERVLLRYTVAGEPGAVGQTTFSAPAGIDAAALEEAIKNNTPVFAAGGTITFGQSAPPKVYAQPTYYLPNCPNGRCPLK